MTGSPACTLGLSPRTRGSPRRSCFSDQRERSIPAHAGEPSSSRPSCGTWGVYPRARGGAFAAVTAPPRGYGLSPRTRGSQVQRDQLAPAGGSIPAHAGEPRSYVGALRGKWVYPRARGGATMPRHRRSTRGGLSPRTRGSRRCTDRGGRRGGSIPAHAGEPRPAPPRTSRKRVYPRARGGAWQEGLWQFGDEGLSPRTRGSLIGQAQLAMLRGSIPAHAGEPGFFSAGDGCERVYPRARGGAHPRQTGRARQRGLSPRTRGSLRVLILPSPVRRSIPAHAGEPLGENPRSHGA